MCIVILKPKQLFAINGVCTERGPKCCFPIPVLPFQEKISVLSFIMFISLKLEQMIDFVLSIRPKRRARKERYKRERERERERERR